MRTEKESFLFWHFLVQTGYVRPLLQSYCVFWHCLGLSNIDPLLEWVLDPPGGSGGVLFWHFLVQTGYVRPLLQSYCDFWHWLGLSNIDPPLEWVLDLPGGSGGVQKDLFWAKNGIFWHFLVQTVYVRLLLQSWKGRIANVRLVFSFLASKCHFLTDFYFDQWEVSIWSHVYLCHFLSYRKVIYMKIGQNLTRNLLVSSDLACNAWFQNCAGFYEGGPTWDRWPMVQTDTWVTVAR